MKNNIELNTVLPTREREKHDELEVQDWREAGIETGVRVRVKWEKRDALLVYLRLRLITEVQFTAGMLFRLDFYAIGKEPRVISAYRPFIDQSGDQEWRGEWGEIRKRAAKRYNKAARKLAGKALLDMAISCICRGEFVGPGRIKRLRQALDLL